MLKWIKQKLDSFSRRTLLAQAVKTRAYQLQKARPGLSYKDAETFAYQDALASMRANQVDIMSYPEVREWSVTFLSGQNNDGT
jgi:hypothetical protein